MSSMYKTLNVIHSMTACDPDGPHYEWEPRTPLSCPHMGEQYIPKSNKFFSYLTLHFSYMIRPSFLIELLFIVSSICYIPLFTMLFHNRKVFLGQET